MQEKYDFKVIEEKYQKIWKEKNIFKCELSPKKKKFYYLDMFPYPSGEMHIGHVRNYVLGDVISRFMIMRGYNVLHPMGWDAFGLPAENAAIQQKIHPAKLTQHNVDKMREQIKSLGISYDWEREINTSSSSYYKWTQWIFVKMYKRGLAYKKMMPINWCPKCLTGLANEEVQGGRCERCGEETTKRDLSQWMLKITAYADRLLNDLDKLNWPEKVKIMQKNWIGKSEGAEVTFKIISAKDGKEHRILIFTTRPDTLFGATFFVLAPEHPLLGEITEKDREKEVKMYLDEVRKKSDIDRTSKDLEKTGIFTGAYAINPVNSQKIPVYIADYVLMSYGTGAIMAVPAHDERDFEFAKKYDIPIIEVISSPLSLKNDRGDLLSAWTNEGVLINSEHFSGLYFEDAKWKINDWLKDKKLAKRTVNYKLRDWVFSRQRYWGEPIPVIYCDTCGEQVVEEDKLPVLLPEVENYQPPGDGRSPLSGILEFVHTECPKCKGPAERETDTMPQWAGSSWYFLRFADPHNQDEIFNQEVVHSYLPVDQYVGGIEHAILHLLYARFFTKVLYDVGVIKFDEPFLKLFNQGMVLKDGAKMSKSRGNVVSPDEIIEKYGADTLRLFILFVAPPEFDAEWSDKGVEGCFRFLNRVWRLFRQITDNDSRITNYELIDFDKLSEREKKLIRKVHKTIKRVSEDMDIRWHFNVVVSSLMELVNEMFTFLDNDKTSPSLYYAAEKLVLLLSPFVPHLAEELWSKLGKKSLLYFEKWPTYQPEYLIDEEITVVVQINGKVRDKITVEADISEEELKEKILQKEKIEKIIKVNPLKKFIYVKGKLVNMVI